MLDKQNERDNIAKAIAAVEAKTDAELVTVLAKQSDDYHYIPSLWAAMIALVMPSVLWFTDQQPHYELVLWGQAALFIVLAALFRLPWIMIKLVPKSSRHWRASNMARRQFLELGLHHTDNETGVLIFVSEAEQYVEILVDRGVSTKIAQSNWQAIVDRFIQQVKSGDTEQGFLECVNSCGALLEKFVPSTGAPHNELENKLILIE